MDFGQPSRAARLPDGSPIRARCDDRAFAHARGRRMAKIEHNDHGFRDDRLLAIGNVTLVCIDRER